MRMKVFCSKKAENQYEPEKVDLAFTAVYDGSEENKMYWEMTPAGSIELSTVNKSVVEKFEVGKDYYVDFTPAQD